MTDIFRVDYYPHRAHAKFMGLKGDEIAMLIQIINLIYLNNGPIANDGRYLSQSIYDFGTAKCNRLVRNLVDKGHLYITERGLLGQKMTEAQLKLTRDRSETRARSGSLGGKTRTENEENQQLDLSNSTSTNTNTNTNTNKPPTPLGKASSKNDGHELVNKSLVEGVLKNGIGGVGVGGGYRVQDRLSDDAWQDARAHAPGWDINQLASVYNEGINSGKREPPKYPNKAFPVWCKKYTKGKSML